MSEREYHRRPPLLQVHGVWKEYAIGSRLLPVLQGVDLSAEEGSMVMLVGSSGAGKSTLLHIVGLLDRPTKGEVLFGGERIDALSSRKQARFRCETLGFVFQFYFLLPEFTALENVLIPSHIRYGYFSWQGVRREKRKRAHWLMERVGLSDRANHRPSELSGGERQRVALARALMNDPALVLCDEPTGNLDNENKDRVLSLMRELQRDLRKTFLVVTHDERLAAAADRIYHISDGRIVEQRKAGEVATDGY